MDLRDSLQRALHYLRSGPPEKCVSICDETLGEDELAVQARYELATCLASNLFHQ